jgi:hypothetical protein
LRGKNARTTSVSHIYSLLSNRVVNDETEFMAAAPVIYLFRNFAVIK